MAMPDFPAMCLDCYPEDDDSEDEDTLLEAETLLNLHEPLDN